MKFIYRNVQECSFSLWGQRAYKVAKLLNIHSMIVEFLLFVCCTLCMCGVRGFGPKRIYSESYSGLDIEVRELLCVEDALETAKMKTGLLSNVECYLNIFDGIKNASTASVYGVF